MAADAASSWTARRLATTGAEIHAIAGAVFRDEPAVITASNNGTVDIWRLTDGTNVLSLLGSPWEDIKARRETDRPVPTALAVQGETLYIGWTDGKISKLDLTTGLEGDDPAEIHELGSTITALLPLDLPDGRQQMVSTGTDGRVVLMSPRGDEMQELLVVGQTPMWSLAAVGDEIFAGGRGRLILRWSYDETSVTPITSLRGVGSKPSRLLLAGLSANMETLVASYLDRIVSIHVMGQNRSTFESGVGEVTALLRYDTGRPAVAVGGADGTVAILDPLAASLAGHEPVQPAEPLVETGERPRRRETDPAPAPLLVGPITIGEPVAALGSVESGGQVVLVAAGRSGGVYVVEAGVSDQVELQDDVPATEVGADRLRRSPLAQALAVRMKRRHEDGHEASFLVHLDGRWGSGKTTVLNFVASELGDGWTIVRYNAWRQSRVGPPWWTLLTALRDEIVQRRSWFGRVRLWFREMLEQRVRRASGLPATILLLLLAAGVFVLFRPSGDASQTVTTVQGVAAAVTALATLWAGAEFVARFFGWHSPRGAKAFQDLDANPMDRVASHFTWLVGQEKRPIAYFIDDIDRCPAEDVVELLENVQTLVRDAGESQADVLSPCFVVAGDGAWIRNAFEEHYADFADQIAEPGRPLGYLFLAKIFQLTLPVPRIGPDRQAQFFRELLGLDDDPVASPELVDQARQQVAAAGNDEAQQAALARFPRAVREEVAPAAVARQTEPAFAQATEHRLTGFAPLLPDNPRAVKRFLNAFAMTRSVRTVEGQAIPTAALALWTILQTRWPRLADALADHPDWCLPDPAGVPAPIRELLDHPEVQAVLAFTDGGPLTPDLVRACSGG